MKFIEKHRKKLIVILIVIVANFSIVNLYFTINDFDESKNIYLHFLGPLGNLLLLFYLIHYFYSRYTGNQN